jgi:hypothetical protein
LQHDKDYRLAVDYVAKVIAAVQESINHMKQFAAEFSLER